MSLIAGAIDFAERTFLPDALLKFGVSSLVGATRRRLSAQGADAEAIFARAMEGRAVAEHAEAANQQHYELPEAFFGLVLGPHRKYSSCLYADGARTLAEAEACALAATCAHADLAEGQSILELGCGWGSLSLWMAEALPNATITAVSNSRSQRAYIEGQAAARGLANLTVVTCDMNDFAPTDVFDRIVSVEMFEHMSNWRNLLARMRGWLAPQGRAFIHVFTHRTAPYRFDHRDEADWIGRYFFTGGVMPSHGLIAQFPDLFAVEAEWVWNGRHYKRTALDWLANFDRNAEAVMRIMEDVYASDARLWFRRWRLFFLSTAGLFGHASGEEWGVSHYRLAPAG
jgi:cyclopropane-fatty-acyl-phospholipid synthase